jgi:hypothetical protein
MATTVTDKECVEYARKCVRFACLPIKPSKISFLKIACRWMETACASPER